MQMTVQFPAVVYEVRPKSLIVGYHGRRIVLIRKGVERWMPWNKPVPYACNWVTILPWLARLKGIKDARTEWWA